MKAKEVLQKFAIDFIENHFDEIDLEKCELEHLKSKKEVIKEIKSSKYFTDWVITEVMNWATPISYITDYTVENDQDRFVVKIDGRYFAYVQGEYRLEEVFPKVTMIEKLIFE